MKGVKNDLAAKYIRLACSKQFPREAKKTESLDPEEVMLVNISDADCYEYNKLFGTIYNGTTDWRITEVIISMGADEKMYKVDLTYSSVPPLEVKAFHLNCAGSCDAVEVYIVSASGYRK